MSYSTNKILNSESKFYTSVLCGEKGELIPSSLVGMAGGIIDFMFLHQGVENIRKISSFSSGTLRIFYKTSLGLLILGAAGRIFFDGYRGYQAFRQDPKPWTAVMACSDTWCGLIWTGIGGFASLVSTASIGATLVFMGFKMDWFSLGFLAFSGALISSTVDNAIRS